MLRRRLLPRLMRAAGTAGLIVLAWLLLPPSLGGGTTSTIVSGHSMEPLYYTGDLVIARAGEPQVGDVVVYGVPDDHSYRVIHRIVDGNGEDGWIMQGDNNDFLDQWHPTNEDVMGIARLHIPHLGSFLHSASNPLMWGSFLLLAAAVALWPRPEPAESRAAEPARAGGLS